MSTPQGLVDVGGYAPACDAPTVRSLAEVPGQVCALLSECPAWALWSLLGALLILVAAVVWRAYVMGFHTGFNLADLCELRRREHERKEGSQS